MRDTLAMQSRVSRDARATHSARAHTPTSETQGIATASFANVVVARLFLEMQHEALFSRVARAGRKLSTTLRRTIDGVRMRNLTTLAFTCFLFAHTAIAADDIKALAQQVRVAENGFAKSMADRDLTAFASFIGADAVFFGDGALRGRDAVVAGWKAFFERPAAPFSWSSESVEVLDSGTLAHSSGPVLDPKGNRIGTFNSIWRREPDGSWKVVFDKGCDACRCKQ
jgi:ketosteroid isomerase-like protein